jgi:hypothetical protein
MSRRDQDDVNEPSTSHQTAGQQPKYTAGNPIHIKAMSRNSRVIRKGLMRSDATAGKYANRSPVCPTEWERRIASNSVQIRLPRDRTEGSISVSSHRAPQHLRIRDRGDRHRCGNLSSNLQPKRGQQRAAIQKDSLPAMRFPNCSRIISDQQHADCAATANATCA